MANVDELVEEVARVIMPSAFGEDKIDFQETWQGIARTNAKAAIKAVLEGIRILDDDLARVAFQAGHDSVWDENHPLDQGELTTDVPRYTHTAVIDALLKQLED